MTRTADLLSGACDSSLTLTTGGAGAWLAQTSEAEVYRFEAERHVSEGSVLLPCRWAESGKLKNTAGLSAHDVWSHTNKSGEIRSFPGFCLTMDIGWCMIVTQLNRRL